MAVQLLPFRSDGSVVLSLTSRAPYVGSRRVCVVHDLFPITHPEWYSATYASVHANLLRRNIATAEKLVVVSPVVADEIAELSGRRCEDIVVAPNAPSSIFCEEKISSKFDLRKRFEIPPENYTVLAVGSLEPRKNLERLIRAVSMINDTGINPTTLLLVGSSASIFAPVGDLGALNNVVFAGRVTDQELASLYSEVDLVAFPSLAEGFGLPAVEALACGARLAVSDIPVFRWICGDHAQYFDPYDEESIAATISMDLVRGSSVPDAERMRDSPRHILAEFDWDRTAELISTVCLGLR
ncbi:glycosyltransferase family 4 protein [Gordonia desulfuricans]|uniref:Glycosyltransferase family 4 protein n=1 Tax=Gordonia desulfuricans TaxID=89051 RepID=A0A7K3LUR7_9ACTN|nr:glycosyltransferase family 1 protein [Gordonia desulfuricans]NDK91671.1 glycosyltransferase family 4 protein [Gordonia desulfuricans]